jgi:ArsR family transcriptional regulator
LAQARGNRPGDVTAPSARTRPKVAANRRSCRGDGCAAEARPLTTVGAERLVADLEVFAHPVRAQILDILVRRGGRVCVCHIEDGVPVKQPTVSHHLRLLREAGVVDSERDGHWMYYSVKHEALGAVRARIEHALQRFD